MAKAKSRIKANVSVTRTRATKPRSQKTVKLGRGRKSRISKNTYASVSGRTRINQHRTGQASNSTHHTNGSSSDQSHVSARTISNSAARLIDQAAALIKEGLSIGVREGQKGRQMIKDEAFDVINTATKNLNQVVNVGAEYIKKGIKKI